jgi:tyrosine-specific transport protein
VNTLRLLGGILLIAGTTIGGGMLALPVSTGIAGFWPSVILFVVVWGFMAYTAFLFLETNITMEGRVNLISMARRTLGPVGEVTAWVCYLLLLYSLTAAYISGSGALLVEAVSYLFSVSLSNWWGPLPFVVIFGTIVYLGIRSVDYLNRLFMLGLLLTFVILVIVIAPQVQAAWIARSFPQYTIVPLTLVLTSFGFHIIIPSLVNYLERDLKAIRTCLFIGTAAPLVFYIVWQFIIVGAVPLGGLIETLETGQPGSALTQMLQRLTHNPVVGAAAGLFAFFAIVTSFLGVSLSLSDFLRDGLRIEGSRVGRTVVVILTFVPPLIFAWAYPKGFIIALTYAGLLVAILLGMLPIAMVFFDRYVRRRRHEYRVKGGPVWLVIAFAFFVLAVVVEFVDTDLAVALLPKEPL